METITLEEHLRQAYASRNQDIKRLVLYGAAIPAAALGLIRLVSTYVSNRASPDVPFPQLTNMLTGIITIGAAYFALAFLADPIKDALECIRCDNSLIRNLRAQQRT